MLMLHYTVDKYIHSYLFNGHSLSRPCWSICLNVLVMLYFVISSSEPTDKMVHDLIVPLCCAISHVETVANVLDLIQFMMMASFKAE